MYKIIADYSRFMDLHHFLAIRILFFNEIIVKIMYRCTNLLAAYLC